MKINNVTVLLTRFEHGVDILSKTNCSFGLNFGVSRFFVGKACSKKLSLFKVLNSVLIRTHDPLDDDITFGIWLRFFLNNQIDKTMGWFCDPPLDY